MLTTATIVNPTKELAFYLKSHASNSLSKSVLALTTPQYAGQLQGLAPKFPNLQVITGCVDTVGFGIQRNGFSWCVFEKPLTVHETITQIQSDKWTQNPGVLRLSAGHDITIPLANTLFQTGKESTMFVGEDYAYGLHVGLPLDLRINGGYRPVVPLSDNLKITSCQDNMLKTIDNQAAASFLEGATKLINPTTQNRTVFAQVNGTFYKVTAGGGGLWSPRTRMLVLDTAANPKVGDEIRFWLSTDTVFEQEQKERLESVYSEFQHGIVLECAPVQENLDEQPLQLLGKQGFQPVFGIGSELGFFLDDHQHSVVAETCHLLEA